MKKKLFTLLLCAFAVVSANASRVEGGVLIIEGSSDIPSNPPTESFTTIKLVGDFTSGWSGNWFINGGNETVKNAVTLIDMEGAYFKSQEEGAADETCSWGFVAFRNTNLKIKFPKEGFITNIPHEAFKDCGMSSVTIPGYIKNIRDNAFVESSDAHYLNTVIFEEYGHTEMVDGREVFVSDVNMNIAFQAFQLTYGLDDVYVNSIGNLTAANNAFPLHQTWTHGDVKLVPATLHFPEENADNYYNSNHPLDEATANNDEEFHKWLVAHYEKAGEARNGWYEFVSSGITSKKAWPAQFLMTYSHPTLDQIVPNGVKAYVVNDIKTSGDKVTLKLKSINVIPAGTGVILYGGANSKTSTGDPTVSMMSVNYEGPVYDRNSSVKNYLTATASTILDYSTYVKPYGQDRSGNYYRDFVFGKFSKTDSGKKYYKAHGKYGNYTAGRAEGDWYGFFRVKEGTINDINPGKAYLHLSLTEYPLADGGEIIMDVAEQRDGSIGGEEFYRTEYSVAKKDFYTEAELKEEGLWYIDENTPLEWVKNWGKRDLDGGFTMAKFMGEIEDEEWMAELEATGISSVATKESKNNVIYNLQGMKVAQPQKGIYIQNGKKYIVK